MSGLDMFWPPSSSIEISVSASNNCLPGEMLCSLTTWGWHAAASIVARKETWRRRELWNRVREFQDLTGIPITSPVISLVVGTEQKALQASRHMFMSGFHVTPVGPPAVPPNSCRLRVVLSAVHTADDMKKLATALSQCLDLKEVASRVPGRSARL